MDDTCDFKIGDTVWAKVKGYPWWPAYVTDLSLVPNVDEKDQCIVVNFIGDHSHAKLPPRMVQTYKDGYAKNSTSKSKCLQPALEIANKYHEDQIGRTEVDEFNLQYAKKVVPPTPKKAPPSPTKENSQPVSPKKRK